MIFPAHCVAPTTRCRRVAGACLLALVFPLAAPGVHAGKESLVLEYENDVFAGRDRWYTSGVRASWVRPASARMHDFVYRTGLQAGLLERDSQLTYGFALGHNIYTPADIEDPQPAEDDRPYAGWLYWSTGVGERRGSGLSRALLTVGLIGPASGAERVQKEVHRLIDTDMPRGWDTQLENEPTVMFSYERNWRLAESPRRSGWSGDLFGHAGATLGTPYTLAGGGLTLRGGRHMPDDFSPPRIQPAFPGSLQFRQAERWGWYLFAGFDVQARAHDTFLDGNSFRDSRSVPRKKGVGEIMAGMALAWRDLRISQTFTQRSREFDGQDAVQRFGSLSLTLQW